VSVGAAGWWSRHAAHTIVLAGPMVVIVAIAVGADARAWIRRRGLTPLGAAMTAAVVLSAAASIVHVAVCPEHLREAAIYGVFFAAVASVQLGWAACARLKRWTWLPAVGLAGNLAIVVLWAVTRTVGVPLGPGAGEVESIGVLDIVATACEVGVVVACAVALHQRTHRVSTSRSYSPVSV
jgi:hypothetical protein